MTARTSIRKALLMPLATCLTMLTGAAATQEAGQSYAIQNVQTRKNLRPQGANKADQTGIILYNHHAWKCMTWHFDPVGENTYQLRNLYTSKTLEPSSTLALWQKPISTTGDNQQWEFIANGDDTYLIRLKGTDRYISIASEETNSAIVLLPKQNSSAQKWRLVPQNPWF